MNSIHTVASSLRPQLRRLLSSRRAFCTSSLVDAVETHSTNLAALQPLEGEQHLQPAEELWRSWLAGNGSTAAAGLWRAAREEQDWKAIAFLSYSLWYHDGVPAVHTQAARWAAWDMAGAAVRSAPHVAPSASGPEHAAFTAACTVLHMLAPRRWGKLPVARPASWLQRAAAAADSAPPAHPWGRGFTLLAHHQTTRQSATNSHATDTLLQHASGTGLPPASHAYAVHLRAGQGQPLVQDLGGFFDQPWAAIARVAASNGWAPSSVLLGQSLLQSARSCRKEAAKGGQGGAFKRAVQLQRKGAEYLHTAAGTGSIDAAAALGVMLRSGGAGMAPHQQEAQRLLQRAAAHGHINAMFHLALLSKDAGMTAEYHQWLEQAARGGHAAAQQHLKREKPQLAAAILAGTVNA